MTTPLTQAPAGAPASAPSTWDGADWDALLSAATIGTDRRGGSDETAAALLDAAAVAALQRRAGVLPGSAEPLPAAPAETLPLCAPAPGRRLAALLADRGEQMYDLLGEWLALAVRAGVRLPAEVLPDLLDAGRARRDLRPGIVAAGGRRALWLAGQNPDWSYLGATVEETATPEPAAWSEGTPGQRAGYLTALRRTDPAVALELLADEWSGIGPQERPALVGALEVGLGPADEAFLEAALDDRRKEVREVAARLLRKLPGSAYNARMARRAREIVALPVGGPVRVQPPAACDKFMRRDGVPPKPPAGVTIGERAWWVREILARTPLEVWPADLAGREIADDWATDLWHGLARAAAERADQQWAERLLPLAGPDTAADLYPVVSEPVRLAAAVAVMAGEHPYQAVDLLSTSTPWPDQVCAAVLDAIDRLARSTTYYYAEPLYRLAALRLPVRYADVVHRRLAAAGDDDSARGHHWQRIADTLRLRSDMHAEFTNPTEEYA